MTASFTQRSMLLIGTKSKSGWRISVEDHIYADREGRKETTNEADGGREKDGRAKSFYNDTSSGGYKIGTSNLDAVKAK